MGFGQKEEVGLPVLLAAALKGAAVTCLGFGDPKPVAVNAHGRVILCGTSWAVMRFFEILLCCSARKYCGVS